MTKTTRLSLSFLISITLIMAGCNTQVEVSSADYLQPADKNTPVPKLANPAEVKIPFFKNATWASELSKFVPVYENPEFMPEKDNGKPQIYRNPLNKKATDLDAQTYHKADPRAVFDWFDKNYSKLGYSLKKPADGKDPRVYIVVDEHGYFILSDGQTTMEIHIWKLDGYNGWVKVVYQGTTNKDCGCEEK